MFKADVVLDLIAKTLGMEGSEDKLALLLELYVTAYIEDLDATEDLSAQRAACADDTAPRAVDKSEPWWSKTPEVESSPQEGAAVSEAHAIDWNEEPKAYRGFLSIRCAHCGQEHTYYAKYPFTYHKCNACAAKTDLLDMIKVYTNCECGQRSRYMTNQAQDCFDIPCISCGSLVPVEYIDSKHIYATPWSAWGEGTENGGVSDATN